MLYIVNLKVKDMMVVVLFMNDLKLYSVWAIIVNKIMLCVCRSEWKWWKLQKVHGKVHARSFSEGKNINNFFYHAFTRLLGLCVDWNALHCHYMQMAFCWFSFVVSSRQFAIQGWRAFPAGVCFSMCISPWLELFRQPSHAWGPHHGTYWAFCRCSSATCYPTPSFFPSFFSFVLLMFSLVVMLDGLGGGGNGGGRLRDGLD